MRELAALVVDDEPLARRRLRALLGDARGVRWIGEAATGAAALRAIEELSPELVFLDVEMPGMTGLQVAERSGRPVQIVFTTAYDRYAVTAFELHAADYLLKPFGPERLQAAIDRAHDLTGESAHGPLERIFVRERSRILPVATRQIVRLQAEGDYVLIQAAGRTHLVTATLQDLHERLDQERFLRIHRSHVVNLDFVVAFEPGDGGRLSVRLGDGTRVLASRARSRELRKRVL